MKIFYRPLSVAVLWMGSLGLAVMATKAWVGGGAEAGAGNGEAAGTGAKGMGGKLEGLPGGGQASQGMSGRGAAETVREVLGEPDALARVAGIAEVLPQVTGGNALEVLEAFRAMKPEKGRGLAMEGELILLQVGRVAGLSALERGRPQDAASPKVPAQFDLVMRGLAGTDPDGALRYWRGLPDGPYKSSLRSGLLNGLADNNTTLARDFFASLPPADQVGQIPNLTHQIKVQEGSAALQKWFDGVPEDPAHPTVKWTTFHAVAEELQESPAENAPFMTREASKPHAAADIYNDYAVAWTDKAPVEALEWAAGLPAPEGTTLRSDTLDAVISRWSADDSGGVGDWLNANGGSPHYDEVAARYAQQMSVLDPGAAVRWTDTIRDAALRAVITERIGGNVAVVE